MKSTFMNEIYELKKEILLLRSLNDRNESKESENSHTTNIMETKLVFLEKENSILRSELESKQKIIVSLLEINSSFLKSIRDPSSVVIQDSASTDSKISNGIREINRKKTNPAYKSEQITTTSKSNSKLVATKNSVIIVGDSIVKHLTGLGISKKNNIKIKTNHGATTDNIIDYIKSSIRKKPDYLLVHSGTNDLANGINTMTKTRKVVAAIKEMDKERKIKLGFFSIICREDVDKTDEIIAVNDRLQKYCLSKGLLFVDNSNINVSCLNIGKLHLNRQSTSILADNFRNSLLSSR